MERKEGVLPEAGVSSEQFEMLQKEVQKMEESVEEAKKEHNAIIAAEIAVEKTVNKTRLSVRRCECERDRFEKDTGWIPIGFGLLSLKYCRRVFRVDLKSIQGLSN